MSGGGATVDMSSQGVSIEVKKDGTAILSHKIGGKTEDYSWEKDDSQESTPETVYIVFESEGTAYKTVFNVAENSMVMKRGLSNGNSIEYKYVRVL